MSATTYEELRHHLGHQVQVVGYSPLPGPFDPVNVAVECVTCGTVLLDADHPEVEQPRPTA